MLLFNVISYSVFFKDLIVLIIKLIYYTRPLWYNYIRKIDILLCICYNLFRWVVFMYNNINLNLYKDFYAVSIYGSLAKAAENTYTSAPAISKSIKKLESELNTKLFYRKASGMELTEHGKELLYYVERSFNNLLMAERNMLEADNLERGKLSIGMPSNIGSFFLYDKIIDFHNKYPNVEITIITGSTSKLVSLLDTHQIDFIIDSAPIKVNDDNVIIRKLAEVKYVFIANKNSEYQNISSIKELKNKQLILPIKGTTNRNQLDLLFSKYKICKLNALNLHTSEMIISAVKKNLGIGYVIEDLIMNDYNIVILNIKETLPKAKIMLVYNKKYIPIAPRKFINTYIDKEINF